MKLKPGQIATINNTVYRAKKKEDGCKGCAFIHNIFQCPAVVNQKSGKSKVNCILWNIILVKI